MILLLVAVVMHARTCCFLVVVPLLDNCYADLDWYLLRWSCCLYCPLCSPTHFCWWLHSPMPCFLCTPALMLLCSLIRCCIRRRFFVQSFAYVLWCQSLFVVSLDVACLVPCYHLRLVVVRVPLVSLMSLVHVFCLVVLSSWSFVPDAPFSRCGNFLVRCTWLLRFFLAFLMTCKCAYSFLCSPVIVYTSISFR